MEKLHIRKIASLGLMLCFFTGVGAQTPVKVEKRKEHKSNTVIPVVKGNVTDTLSLVSFNIFMEPLPAIRVFPEPANWYKQC